MFIESVKKIKINQNMSELWYAVCKNIILTLVLLLVLSCDLFIKAGPWITRKWVNWRWWASDWLLHSFPGTDRRSKYYAIRTLPVRHIPYSLVPFFRQFDSHIVAEVLPRPVKWLAKLGHFLPRLAFFFWRVRKIEKATISFKSVPPSGWKNWAPTSRIFMKFNIWVLFDNLLRKFQFHWNRTRIKGILHEDQNTFSIKSRLVLLRMKNSSDASCRETRNTRFIFNNFFFKSCRSWDNVEKCCTTGQATDDNTAHAYCMLWMPKATNTQVMWYSLFLHCNNGCTNAPEFYGICTLPVCLWDHSKITRKEHFSPVLSYAELRVC